MGAAGVPSFPCSLSGYYVELSWVLREWGKSFAGLLAELLVVFSVVYLLLRLLMRFFHWPNSLFAWLVARVSAVFGIAAPQPIGWFAGLLFFLAASLCFVNFLYLSSGVMNLARIGAMAATWRRFYLRRILPQVVTLIRRAR